MARLHPAFLALPLVALVACFDKGDDEDDGDDDGPSCNPAAATGPTGTSVYGTTIYQPGDVVQDVDLIGPDGSTVSLYDMCGTTVMLVHGEMG